MFELDHLALPARNPAASARWLAELLELPPPRPEGPDADMFSLRLGNGVDLLYAPAAGVTAQHLALRTTPARFEAVRERLRQRSWPYGNDPEQPANGHSSDFLGGHGRIYFHDPEGHLLEVLA